MVKEVLTSDNCFLQSLQQQTRNPWLLIRDLSLALLLLVSVPILIVCGARHFYFWPLSSELVAIEWLKIMSIFMHAIHIFNRDSSKEFRIAIGTMFATGLFLVAFIFRDNCSNDGLFCTTINSHIMGVVVVFGSFFYMALFAYYNKKIIKKLTKPTEMGRKLFLETFLYAVNYPAFIALVFIFVIYVIVLDGKQELFLSGAAAFLILTSAAATVCIDYFGKAFLNINSCNPSQPEHIIRTSEIGNSYQVTIHF